MIDFFSPNDNVIEIDDICYIIGEDNSKTRFYVAARLEKFPEDLDNICYVDDYGCGYTGTSFLELAGGNRSTANLLFESLAWQCPDTLLQEWLAEDLVYECPCGAIVINDGTTCKCQK